MLGSFGLVVVRFWDVVSDRDDVVVNPPCACDDDDDPDDASEMVIFARRKRRNTHNTSNLIKLDEATGLVVVDVLLALTETITLF